MQFKLTLQSQHTPTLLPFNYQYPLSSAIYKIIQKADADFAAFLHNTGYGEGHKSFKLFTFSDLQTAFRIQGDRMELPNEPVQLMVCFHVTEAAENFIKGLFMHQQLEIADRKSKASFVVQQVESLQPIANVENEPITLQPLSALVVGKKNERGHYDYRSPLDNDFAECLVHNWVMKYAAANNIEEDTAYALKRQIDIAIMQHARPPKQRLITIKEGTPHETKVRGYTGFSMQVKAPGNMITLALNAGLGLHNAQGMGCVGVV